MADNPSAYVAVTPTHVVVDTLDGYVFSHGADGVLFTTETAKDFSFGRNKELKPEYQSYKVFKVTEETDTTLADEHTANGEPLPGTEEL